MSVSVAMETLLYRAAKNAVEQGRRERKRGVGGEWNVGKQERKQQRSNEEMEECFLELWCQVEWEWHSN